MGIFAAMKTSALILFVSIVTLVYGLVNYYIFSRGVQVFPSGSPARIWFIVIFWTVASTFVLARFLERAWPCGFTGVVTWIGSFWLAFMLYLILAILVIDLSRVLNHFFHIFPSALTADYQKTILITFWIVLSVVTVVVVAGYINARTPRIKVLNLSIDKPVEGDKHLKIVMASDIHLGTIISRRKANRLVEQINTLKPDLVLFAGDVVDEDLTPVIKNNLGANLGRIESRLGVFAITGNHEYIGGADAAIKYLTEHGVKMLRDTAMLVDGRFYLVGRDDRDKPRFSGRERKELETVMEGVDKKYPVILMDHQPFNLSKTVSQGVDLSLSGHTHHGQLWPFNYITKAIYEISWGYRKIGGTHFYVSSGFGTWGPPVRLGNRPEIVVINLTFN
jgi:predicted MPP superfamily phosphohydrolase